MPTSLTADTFTPDEVRDIDAYCAERYIELVPNQNCLGHAERWLRNLKPLFIIPLGFIGGLVLGVIARLWMRWISTDPEFTWGGTIGILVGFTLFFTAQSTVFFAVRKGWSRRSTMIARIVAIPLSLLLFTAQGAIMLPTVVTGSLAMWRKSWPKWVRVILGLASLVIPVTVVKGIAEDFGWGIATIGRILLFVLIYGLVIAITQPLVSRSPGAKPISRKKKIIFALALLLLIGFPLYMGGLK